MDEYVKLEIAYKRTLLKLIKDTKKITGDNVV